MQGVLLTFQKLVDSNKSFLHALNSGETPKIDPTIKTELLILYIKINYHYRNLNNYQLKLFYEIINGNFTISDDKITAGEKTITTKELRNAIIEIEQKKSSRTNRVIQFKPSRDTSTDVVTFPSVRKCNVVYIFNPEESLQKNIRDSKREFTALMKVNNNTRRYISSVESKYNNDMSKAIINALSGSLKHLNYNIRLLLEGHLSIFPLIYAVQNSLDIIEQLSLPQSSIGVARNNHTNVTIKAKKNKIRDLKIQIEKTKNILQYYQDIEAQKESHIYQRLLTSLENQFVEENFALYQLSQSPSIYNRSLIDGISRAISENHIEMNEKYNDPIITFFAIDSFSKEADFHCSMHLTTFTQLLGEPEEEKKLKK